MNDAEAIMWAVESDPFLRSDFLNLILLEGSPDLRRLRAGIERVIAVYPPLRQRVARPPLGLAPPTWADDHDFDLDYHIRRLAVPPPGTHRQLLDLAAVVAAPPLDRSRPLWELTVVEGLEDGGAAVLQRVHHSLTDGMGGMKLLRTLLDRTAEGSAGPAAPNPDVWRHPEIYNPAEEAPAPGQRPPPGTSGEWPGRG
ncbi:MAG: wax ester/triacylglycerol synthase domain-containing protein, partial [Acidimicrobiia bacterium]